jgi:two-component system alkaline phosphatase synthesis response regulator PhoP
MTQRPVRVLLVEDERGLVRTLTDMLTADGYEVQSAMDGQEGLKKASAEPWDLILMDVMLPSMSGLQVCEELRRRGKHTPILMLTALSQTRDKVEGFKQGADDYLAKPFDVEELKARIEALLRRSRRAPFEVYEFDGIRVDFSRSRVERQGQTTELSDRECRLMRYFIDNKGRTITRDELLQHVWGYNDIPFTRTVDVHIVWLRQKLETDPRNPRHIVTVHGEGYRFAG